MPNSWLISDNDVNLDAPPEQTEMVLGHILIQTSSSSCVIKRPISNLKERARCVAKHVPLVIIDVTDILLNLILCIWVLTCTPYSEWLSTNWTRCSLKSFSASKCYPVLESRGLWCDRGTVNKTSGWVWWFHFQGLSFLICKPGS